MLISLICQDKVSQMDVELMLTVVTSYKVQGRKENIEPDNSNFGKSLRLESQVNSEEKAAKEFS